MATPSDPTAEQVLTVARVAAGHADADEDALAALLVQAGFSPSDADRAVVFVPSAFARPILQRLGVTEFAATYRVQDRRGAWHDCVLANEPWFRAGLQVAVAAQTHGYAAEGCTGPTPSQAEYEAVLRLSPEISATGQALDQGLSLEGAKMHPLQVQRWQVEARTRSWPFWRR